MREKVVQKLYQNGLNKISFLGLAGFWW